MKLISLNLWCGKEYDLLKSFIERQSSGTDIFCFQEVRNGNYLHRDESDDERPDLFQDLETWLPDFKGYFTTMITGVGIATFVRKNIEVEKIESTSALSEQDIDRLTPPEEKRYYPRFIQSVYLKDKNLVIHNFHGVPGQSKKDTPLRELQTKHLLEVLNKNNSSQIITGDFNLDKNTEAISMIGEQLRNLMAETDFKTTRSSLYKLINEMPFADYAFVSKDIEVIDFKVLPDEVSDHLALMLEFK